MSRRVINDYDFSEFQEQLNELRGGSLPQSSVQPLMLDGSLKTFGQLPRMRVVETDGEVYLPPIPHIATGNRSSSLTLQPKTYSSGAVFNKLPKAQVVETAGEVYLPPIPHIATGNRSSSLTFQPKTYSSGAVFGQPSQPEPVVDRSNPVIPKNLPTRSSESGASVSTGTQTTQTLQSTKPAKPNNISKNISGPAYDSGSGLSLPSASGVLTGAIAASQIYNFGNSLATDLSSGISDLVQRGQEINLINDKTNAQSAINEAQNETARHVQDNILAGTIFKLANNDEVNANSIASRSAARAALYHSLGDY